MWHTAPFYIFRERRRQVWVERIYLTVRGPEGEALLRELEQPRLRAALYDLLRQETEDPEGGLRRELSRLLGPEAERRVTLSRAFLLGP